MSDIRYVNPRSGVIPNLLQAASDAREVAMGCHSGASCNSSQCRRLDRSADRFRRAAQSRGKCYSRFSLVAKTCAARHLPLVAGTRRLRSERRRCGAGLRAPAATLDRSVEQEVRKPVARFAIQNRRRFHRRAQLVVAREIMASRQFAPPVELIHRGSPLPKRMIVLHS